jgi:aminoglycoside phosphotransferase (APT) family kinase protein
MVRQCTGLLTASVIGPVGKVLGFMHNRDYVEVHQRATGVRGWAEADEKRAARLWAAAVDADAWPGPPVWVHRDLQGGNLLTSGDGRLIGVLDFGGLAVGDPAGDVMAAFHVFSSADRSRFRRAMGVDDSTWARARGWAMVQGLEALIYYIDSHPGMVAMARRVIRAALEPDLTRADSA